jgi:hypothetical protein
MNQEAHQPSVSRPKQKASSPGQREPDAIYQNDRLVARPADAEVDLGAKEIRFGELYQSDYLSLPEECEYQNYKILVQRIAHATKTAPGASHGGRVLKGVVAEILGYREQ